MLWLPLALLAAALWALVLVIDRATILRFGYGVVGFVFLHKVFQALVALPLGFAGLPPVVQIPFAFGAGLINGVSVTLTLAAVKRIEAGLTATIMQGLPVVALLFGVLFLGEEPSLVNLAGIAAVVAGTSALVWQGSGGRRGAVDWRAVGMLLGALTLNATWSLLLKQAQVHGPAETAVFGLQWGAVVTVALLMSALRLWGPLVGDMRRLGPGPVLWVAVPATLVVAMFYTLARAYAQGDLALVATLHSTSPVFVLALTVAATLADSPLFRDRVALKSLPRRLALLALVVGGVYLVSLRGA